MHKTKLLGFAALAGLFLIGSLARSPQSQANGAVYSTPVSVVNTTANPGSVLDANTATRVPYQSVASVFCPTLPCQTSFAPVPLGFRLVVEYLGGTVSVNGGAAGAMGQLSATPAFGGTAHWSTLVSGSVIATNPTYLVFAQSVRAYIDPGTPTFGMGLLLPIQNPDIEGNLTLTGYLQDCTVSPCPAQKN